METEPRPFSVSAILDSVRDIVRPIAEEKRLAVRLLAWSTVAQAGWVLLPLAGAGPAGPAQGHDAAAAAVGYLAAYTAVCNLILNLDELITKE